MWVRSLQTLRGNMKVVLTNAFPIYLQLHLKFRLYSKLFL